MLFPPKIIKIRSFLAPIRPVFGPDTPVFGPMPPSPIQIQVKGGRVQGVEWAYSMGRGGGGHDPSKYSSYIQRITPVPLCFEYFGLGDNPTMSGVMASSISGFDEVPLGERFGEV